MVKSGSLRVASRLANNLKAGAAVESYEALEECGVFLVCVPETRLEATLEEMTGSDIAWRGRTVLLWTAHRTSLEAGPLRDRGAFCASIAPVEARRFVVEGHRTAVREVRSLFSSGTVRWLEVRAEDKALLFGGIAIAEAGCAKLIAAALDCFRSAGVSGAEAQNLAETLIAGTLRSSLKGGRPATEIPSARALEALARHDAALARLIAQLAERK